MAPPHAIDYGVAERLRLVEIDGMFGSFMYAANSIILVSQTEPARTVQRMAMMTNDE